MSYAVRSRDAHLANDGSPKRVLALDGGGLRGILTLGILQKIEDVLRERHGDGDDFRLCHYFDLIAGTSTGAIIAATLALGWKVEEIRAKYMSLGERVFQKSPLRHGVFRAKYDEAALIDELQNVYGPDRTLDSEDLTTGLLVVTKRLDSSRWWPISNNPRGKYFEARPDGTIGNGDYALWQVVRASTAAPHYFDSELITIANPAQGTPLRGEFIDGGISPFNNPALLALMYATLEGYRIGWPTGAERILLVSVGTGAADQRIARARFAAEHALKALAALMDDCAALQETQLQWMSSSRTARTIDSELGDLRNDLVSGAPLLSYLRYNANFSPGAVRALDPRITDTDRIEALSAMDAPEHMPLLHRIGVLTAERDVRDADFAPVFDLPRIAAV